MNEKVIVEYWKRELNKYEYTKDLDIGIDNYFGQFEEKINMISEILNLLEQKDKRIDELEKALVEEAIKSTEKINKVIAYIKDNMKEHQHDNYDITLHYSLDQEECENILKILEE